MGSYEFLHELLKDKDKNNPPLNMTIEQIVHKPLTMESPTIMQTLAELVRAGREQLAARTEKSNPKNNIADHQKEEDGFEK